MARGRELEVVRGTAKKAAGIDAGEMGRDASVWSGSWSLLFAGLVGCENDWYKDDFIGGLVVAWKSERGCNWECNRVRASAIAKAKASATAGPSTRPFA